MLDVISYLAGILVVVVGIALSIGLHELGHYLPAKYFNVRVKQFMVGFGPTVKSWRRGETEFGIKAIPLGGYILMTGMFPPEKKPARGPFARWIAEARNAEREEIAESDNGRQFHQLSPWKKIVVMLGGPVMNLILGFVLIVSALAGIGTMQNSLIIDEVAQCTEVDIEGNCPSEAPLSPAAQAGLMPGDVVVGVNGQMVSQWEEIIDGFNQNLGASSTLEVRRGDELVLVTLTPIFTERPVYSQNGEVQRDEAGAPITEFRPLIGVILQPQNVPLPLTEATSYAFDATRSTFDFILRLPQEGWAVAASTLGFSERDPAGVVSIVGVGQIAGEVGSANIPLESKLATLLMLLGSLNLALFAFNLIPLLPLDGGHVLGAIYESIKRRSYRLLDKPDPGAIDNAKTLPLAYSMWLVLIAVGILVILADILNPISLG